MNEPDFEKEAHCALCGMGSAIENATIMAREMYALGKAAGAAEERANFTINGDTAFVPGHGTLRACIDCHVLILGGPTRCVDCVNKPAPDAAPKQEQPEKWKCGARESNTGAGDPAECDWPWCGCDPAATKVIVALDEQGALKDYTTCAECGWKTGHKFLCPRNERPAPAPALDLAAIEARCNAATPGPWGTDMVDWKVHTAKSAERICTVHEYYPERNENGRFIAHARQDIPALLQALREREAEIERLSITMKAIDQRWCSCECCAMNRGMTGRALRGER